MECPRYFRRILPQLGVAKKGSLIIEYLHDDRKCSFEGSTILSVRDAMQVKEEYRQHVLDCPDCTKDYFDFLKSVRGEDSLKKADKRHLNVLGDRKLKEGLEAIRQSSQ